MSKVEINKLKLKKGDVVKVITGKDKGKVGEIIKAMPKDNKVLVQGVNMAKRHMKPTQVNPQGGIIEKEMPIHVSNVAYVDISDDKQAVSKIGYKVEKDGSKVRIAKRSGSTVE